MATLEVADAPGWTKFITEFGPTKKLFDDNYAGLVAMGPYVVTRHPELMPEYDRMMAQANKHKSMLDKLGSIYNTVSGWLTSVRSVLNTGTATGTGGWFGTSSGGIGWGGGVGDVDNDGLGLIPVIFGVAAALSALAVIGKWIKDAYFLSRRLNELQRLEGTGLSPKEAAAVVDKASGKVVGFLGVDFRWIVIGGILLVFGPTLFRMLKARQ